MNKKSITVQLVLLYSISTLILFIIVGGILFWVAQDSLQTGTSQYMIDEVHVIRGLLSQHHGDISSIKQEVNGVPSELTNASYHYYIRIYNRPGTTLLQTPGYPSALHNLISPNQGKYISPISKKIINGKSYIILQASIQNTPTPLFMDMALDMTFQTGLLQSFLGKLIVILIGIVGIIVLLGYLIAKRGLSSLQTITHLTNEITPNNLSQRLTVSSWPVELEPLVVAINKMLGSLEASFNRLTECTAELAHELRTPIMNLMIQTETALAKEKMASEYMQTLSLNLEEFHKISSLINNILFLARSEDPRLVINKEITSIKHELNRICDFYSLLANEKNIDISVNAEDIHWNVDKILFERVISKLLENAIEHTQPNGQIIIDCKQTPAGQMHLTVIDNGSGMSQEKQIQIQAKKFYRATNLPSTEPGGLGLGLIIVKTIMGLHQGDVQIKSQLGIGTEICLVFKLC